VCVCVCGLRGRSLASTCTWHSKAHTAVWSVYVCVCVCVCGLRGRSLASTCTWHSKAHTAVWSVVFICFPLITSLSLAVAGLHSVMYSLVQLSILRLIVPTVCHRLLLDVFHAVCSSVCCVMVIIALHSRSHSLTQTLLINPTFVLQFVVYCRLFIVSIQLFCCYTK